MTRDETFVYMFYCYEESYYCQKWSFGHSGSVVYFGWKIFIAMEVN